MGSMYLTIPFTGTVLIVPIMGTLLKTVGFVKNLGSKRPVEEASERDKRRILAVENCRCYLALESHFPYRMHDGDVVD